MARPSSSRPSSQKKSIVAPRSSMTIPTLSIRLSAMCPIYKVSSLLTTDRGAMVLVSANGPSVRRFTYGKPLTSYRSLSSENVRRTPCSNNPAGRNLRNLHQLVHLVTAFAGQRRRGLCLARRIAHVARGERFEEWFGEQHDVALV